MNLSLRMKWTMPAAAILGLVSLPGLAAEFPDPLPPESIPSVATLDTPYPRSFAVVHDFGFGSLPDSAFSLVDTADGTFKGMMSSGNFATLSVSTERGELYVGETYYSRTTRGSRSDLVSVYDMKTLDRLAEVVGEAAGSAAGEPTSESADSVTSDSAPSR